MPKIDRIIISLIRQYILDFAVIGVTIAACIFVAFFCFVKNSEYDEKITTAKNDITKHRSNAEIIRYRNEVIEQGIDIDEMNGIFSRLVPDVEDYYSIITTIETLSINTNFIIHSYSVNVSKSSPTQLSLSINGTGDPDTFLTFLKSYNFSGGRLVTLDHVEYSNQSSAGVKLTMVFYTGSIPKKTTSISHLSSEDKELIKEIQDKVSFQFTPETSLDGTYDVKQNPF